MRVLRLGSSGVSGAVHKQKPRKGNSKGAYGGRALLLLSSGLLDGGRDCRRIQHYPPSELTVQAFSGLHACGQGSSVTNPYPIQRGFEADRPRCKMKAVVQWLAVLAVVLGPFLPHAMRGLVQTGAVGELRPDRGLFPSQLSQPLTILTQTYTLNEAKNRGCLASC